MKALKVLNKVYRKPRKWLGKPLKCTVLVIATYCLYLGYNISQKYIDKSYSIGINSPWGAGKSSFLNLLRKELSHIPNMVVVDFNARASANSFFLHHLLFYQLSENRIKAEDCVFTDDELKKLCLDRLENGLEYFKADKISASDVLYLVLACLNDADPNDSGCDGYDIMPEALDKLKSSIKENPQKYLSHVISHVTVGANKIKFTVKKDYPFRDIFSIDELKNVISSIDTHQDGSLETS